MRHFTTSDGVRLAYRDEGRGLPLLCLSGLSRNSTDFDYVAPHLGDVRLIRLDYRGRGASDRADPATYTVEREAEDVLELLDHLGLDRVAILGTSRGGLVAMVLAARAKQRLLGVCLNDIGPEVAPEGLTAIMDYLGRRPAAKTLEEAARARAKIMAGFEGVPLARWREEAARHYVETGEGLDINYDPRLRDIVLDAGAQPAPDLWPLFDSLIGVPLALIRGANSDLLAPETAAEMRRRRPDMMFADVPGRGHVPFLDEAESLEVIKAFLERLA